MSSQPPKINEQQILADFQQLGNAQSTLPQETKFVDDYFRQSLQLEHIKTLRANNATLEQNNVQRKKYASHIFSFTCIWGTLVFIIILLQGFGGYWWGNRKYSFEISEGVMITLITTTTVNFFGFFLLVVKYLFNTAPSSVPTPPLEEK